MAVSDALNALKLGVSDAYTSVEEKGGTIPANKNVNNLAGAIDSITGGEGITVDIITSSPYSSSQATSHTFTGDTGSILSVDFSPWETVSNSSPYGNTALRGKYPWELSNYDNGVFKFNYVLNGTTLPWEVAYVAGEFLKTPPATNKGNGVQGIPLYMDWANMTFTKTGTKTVRGITGDVYTATEPVTFTAPGMQNINVQVNEATLYMEHPIDGLCSYFSKAAVSDYELTGTTSYPLDWGGGTLNWYDSSTMSYGTGGSGPTVCIWPDYGEDPYNARFPITMRLWVVDVPLDYVLGQLAEAKTFFYLWNATSSSVWKTGDSVLNAWKNATINQGTNTLENVPGVTSKFGYRMSIGTSRPILDVYPTKTNVHVNDEQSMNSYDAVMFTPEGITPPSNINIW